MNKKHKVLTDIVLFLLFLCIPLEGYAAKVEPLDLSTPLIQAIREDDISDALQLINTEVDVDETDAEGRTPVMWAINLDRDHELISQLIDKTKKLDARDKSGQTALMFAAGRGNISAVKKLLGLGADFNIADGYGNTAVIWAERRGYPLTAAIIETWEKPSSPEKPLVGVHHQTSGKSPFSYNQDQAISIEQPFIYGLPAGKPAQILTDQNDLFYIDYGNKIYVFSEQFDYHLVFDIPAKLYPKTIQFSNIGSMKQRGQEVSSLDDPSVTEEMSKLIKIAKKSNPRRFYEFQFETVVSPNGKIYSMIESSYDENIKSQEEGNISYNTLHLAQCEREKCTYKLLKSWSNVSSEEQRIRFRPSELKVSKQNRLFFTIEQVKYSGLRVYDQKTIYYVEQSEESKSEYENQYHQHFPAPKHPMISLQQFIINGVEKTPPFQRSSQYTQTLLDDSKGFPHVFFHDPSDRSFYHYFYNNTTDRIEEQRVDRSESGTEHLIFKTEDEFWSLHYFFRDPFHKGLLVTEQQISEGKIKKQFVIDASKERSTGEELVGAQSSSNRILFSYLSDSHKHKREYVMLSKIQDLEHLGQQFSQYGDSKGPGYLSARNEEEKKVLIDDLASAHLHEIRNLRLSFGLGVQYLDSNIDVKTPQKSPQVPHPYDPQYILSDGWLNLFVLEGHFGQTSFGIQQLAKIMEDQVEISGSKEAKQLNHWKGQLGWEKLFLDYDAKLESERMTTAVFFKEHSKQVESQSFQMNFQEFKLSLLSLNRHHFGVLFQEYNFFQPLFIYKAAAGESSYEFDSQAIGDVNVRNWMFHYGFSTLDYFVKYETEMNKGFVDFELRAGISAAELRDTLQGVKSPKMDWTPIGELRLELGCFFYQRYEGLNQTGGTIRMSYRAEALQEGNTSTPKDRKGTSGEEYQFAYQRSELRHGPLLFFSLNY
ncbi:ankyrin repeat domain-containing protein [Deltaproteobacteria bacterium TL4]